MKKIAEGVFKPKPTTGELKSEATTRVANQIIDSEKAARDRKTERLRLARFAAEKATEKTPPSKPKARSASRSVKSAAPV